MMNYIQYYKLKFFALCYELHKKYYKLKFFTLFDKLHKKIL